MEIAEYKLLYLITIGLTGVLGGLWPVLTGARARYDRFFSLGNAFGGGVFLGAGLIHLLPDAIENYRGLLGPDLDYPLASLICATGFLLVLLLEKVIVGGDEAYVANAASKSRYALVPYVLAIVLSIHSLIAGLALGAESDLTVSAALFVAIVVHKGVAAFALGVSLHRDKIERSKSIGIILLFSTMTPLGIGTGAVLGSALSEQGAQWFEGVFDALAAGTFLYIAVVDIVESEFAKPVDIRLKFAMVFLGLAVMAVVALWT